MPVFRSAYSQEWNPLFLSHCSIVVKHSDKSYRVKRQLIFWVDRNHFIVIIAEPRHRSIMFVQLPAQKQSFDMILPYSAMTIHPARPASGQPLSNAGPPPLDASVLLTHQSHFPLSIILSNTYQFLPPSISEIPTPQK